MTLITAVLLKKITLTVIIIIYLYFCRKDKRHLLVASGAVLLVFMMFAADNLSQRLFPMTDEISFAVVQESSEDITDKSIIIEGYKVDGKYYPAGETISGSWIWDGEKYIWRHSSQNHRPDVCSETLTLEIPVGWSRSVLFTSHSAGGLVEVSAGTDSRCVDTSVAAEIVVQNSSLRNLILDTAIELGVYSAVLLLFLGAWIVFLKQNKTSMINLLQKLHDNCFQLSLLSIAVLSFVLNVVFLGQDSLWSDELALITYVTEPPSIIASMLRDEAWPPVWKGIMYIWYRLVPYGHKWLMLLPELIFLGSVYSIGILGKEIGSKRIGIIAATMLAINRNIILYIASEITCYSLLLLLSILTLYLYVKRFKSIKEYSWKQMLPLMLCMLTAAYTHYFGFFLSGTLFLIDTVLFMRKKVPARYVTSYIVLLLLYCPWLAYTVVSLAQKGNMMNYWQPTPTVDLLLGYISWLCGGRFYKRLAYIGIIIVSATVFYAFLKKEIMKKFPQLMMMLVPGIMFGCVFVYGRYIAAGNTFWVERYFIVTAPCLIILCAFAVDSMAALLALWRKNKPGILVSGVHVVVCVLLTCGIGSSVRQTYTPPEISLYPYEEQSEWIRPYLYEPDTIIVSCAYARDTAGFCRYYAMEQERRGSADCLNVVSIYDISQVELLDYSTVVVLDQHDDHTDFENFSRTIHANYVLHKEDTSMQAFVYTKKG